MDLSPNSITSPISPESSLMTSPFLNESSPTNAIPPKILTSESLNAKPRITPATPSEAKSAPTLTPQICKITISAIIQELFLSGCSLAGTFHYGIQIFFLHCFFSNILEVSPKFL